MARIVKQQLVYQSKFPSLMSNYGLDEETAQYKGTLSFKDYLRHVLEREFWGDEVILYAISCMWGLKISVLNSRMLQEYRICHDIPFCLDYSKESTELQMTSSHMERLKFNIMVGD